MARVENHARFWDRIARKYAADPITDMAGYERTLARTRDYLKGDEVAFEFGCGTGTTALRLAPSLGLRQRHVRGGHTRRSAMARWLVRSGARLQRAASGRRA